MTPPPNMSRRNTANFQPLSKFRAVHERTSNEVSEYRRCPEMDSVRARDDHNIYQEIQDSLNLLPTLQSTRNGDGIHRHFPDYQTIRLFGTPSSSSSVSLLLRELFHEFYDVIPDDSVLSRWHYVHPHPVNHGCNASQKSLYFYVRDVGRRGTMQGITFQSTKSREYLAKQLTERNKYSTERDSIAIKFSLENRRKWPSQNGTESDSKMFPSTGGAVSIENPSSGYKRAEWSPADGNYVARGPRAFLGLHQSNLSACYRAFDLRRSGGGKMEDAVLGRTENGMKEGRNARAKAIARTRSKSKSKNESESESEKASERTREIGGIPQRKCNRYVLPKLPETFRVISFCFVSPSNAEFDGPLLTKLSIRRIILNR
ncbi:hypothetical protein DBV15_06301, partial [Temnothorax longispinosus]